MSEADKITAELMALAQDYCICPNERTKTALEQAIRRAVDSSLEAAKQEPPAGWRRLLELANQEQLDACASVQEGGTFDLPEWAEWVLRLERQGAAPSPGSVT